MMKPQINRNRKVAVLIDLKNSIDLDLADALAKAKAVGRVEEARTYSDFRQYHIGQMAMDLLVLDIQMVHCPSYRIGTREDGSPRWKPTDDAMMAKEVRDLLQKRPGIGTFVLVGGDGDMIASCLAIKAAGRHVVVMSNTEVSRLIKVNGALRRCADQYIEVRRRPDGDLLATPPPPRNGNGLHRTPSISAPEFGSAESGGQRHPAEVSQGVPESTENGGDDKDSETLRLIDVVLQEALRAGSQAKTEGGPCPQ
jgi:uncharacterized LabA/DUF88 family protein